MQAFITSTLSVAVAEIGDKTQLLALLLATRFKSKSSIILGIVLATLLNHFAAAWIGQWSINWISTDLARYIVAASFFAIGVWVLIPDKPDKEESRLYKYGPLVATFVLFFLAEIGDKTQVVTVVLAAKYQDLFSVVMGTTLGMLLANVPVVIAGHYSAEKLPLTWIHRGCSLLFVILGLVTLLYG